MAANAINLAPAELTVDELRHWQRRIPKWIAADTVWFDGEDAEEWLRRIPAWIEFHRLSSDKEAQ